LLAFDFDKQRVVRRCEIVEPPFRQEDPNPRGGFRGLKGLCVGEDFIAIANSSTIFLYDPNWKPITYFWHPSCANIHDIVIDQGQIWVTSAQNDLLLRFNIDGSVTDIIYLRDYAHLINGIDWRPPKLLTHDQFSNGEINFRDPRTHSWALSDSAHVNGIAILPNGDKLVSCGLMRNQNQLQLMRIKRWLERFGVWEKIYKLNSSLRKIIIGTNVHNQDVVPVYPVPGTSAVFRIKENNQVESCLVLKDVVSPSHSIHLLSDLSAIYLDTTRGAIIIFNPDSGQIRTSFTIGTNFLRGIRQLSDETLLIGDGNKLVHFDLSNGQIIFSTTIAEMPNDAIYDIEVLPNNFKLPPTSLVEQHRKYFPINQI
jgi:hypothetical protein